MYLKYLELPVSLLTIGHFYISNQNDSRISMVSLLLFIVCIHSSIHFKSQSLEKRNQCLKLNVFFFYNGCLLLLYTDYSFSNMATWFHFNFGLQNPETPRVHINIFRQSFWLTFNWIIFLRSLMALWFLCLRNAL